MPPSFEKEYYEYQAFWEEERYSAEDQERLDFALRLIPGDAATVLDIGCGNGMLCNRLKELSGKFVIGADRSPTALKYVNAEKLQADIANLPFKAQSFDLVAALEVLEHLPFTTFAKALDEIARVSRKYIRILVPNNEDLRLSMTTCPKCLTIFNRAYHLRSFTEDKLKGLFTRYGFRAQSIYRVGKTLSSFGVGKIKALSRNLGRYPLQLGDSICPMCGYSDRGVDGRKFAEVKHLPVIREKIKQFLKSIWPHKESFRWLMALFEKKLG